MAWLIDTRQVYGHVFNVYVSLGLAVFALFALAIIGTAVWFRVRPRSRPSRRHEANRLEMAYAVVLACVAAGLLVVTFDAEHKDDVASAAERPALTVDVTGARWEWIFHYPRYGITEESGYVGDQPLVVPIDRAVRFRLRSVDVIHSFWIPQLRFKRDAIPGTVESVTLDFDRSGTFGGSCAEFCGLHHSEMVFTVDALKPRAFRSWLAGHRESAA